MTDRVKYLEDLIAEYYAPVFSKYYELIGEPEPIIGPEIKKKLPALLSGDFAFTSDRRKARKN